jgi:nitrogen regulatory protein P-II 1
MKEIKAIIRATRLQEVLRALHEHPELPGVTVSKITGFGRVVGRKESTGPSYDSITMSKVECIVPDAIVDEVTALIRDTAHTGRPGDGKIVVLPVDSVVRIRTGDRVTDSS